MRKFNLYFAILSVAVDAAVLYGAMIVAYELRAQTVSPYLWDPARYSFFVAGFVPVWIVLLSHHGLYRLRSPLKGFAAVSRIVTAILSGWALVLIYLYLSRSPEALVFPRLIIAYGVVLSIVGVVAGRICIDVLRRLLNRNGLGLTRTVVVARTDQNSFVHQLRHPAHGRRLVAVVTTDFVQSLSRLVKDNPIDEVIIAWPDLPSAEVLKILDWAETNFIAFAQLPTLLSVRATNVESGSLAGSSIIYYNRSPLDGWGRVFKRILDIVTVVPLLIISFPLFLLLAVAVRLSSPGPIIYREKRIGQDGREILLRKFRTMYVDWRERFPHLRDWAADEKTDVRITPIGRVLRRTNLDELPQLWDVFIGRMSLVGPRPEQPKYVAQFASQVPNYRKRHYVKSGLTGWAQINGLRGDTPIPERTAYDLYYIQHWSIWFDVRIIIGTVLYMWRQLVGGR